MKERSYDRVGVDYSASFSRQSQYSSGTIHNLSMVGCRCRTSFVVTKGERLGLLIHVPGHGDPLYVSLAEVRWSHGQEFGLEFIHMELNDRRRLSEVIRLSEGPLKHKEEATS
jgi:hypothetical protein